MNPLQKLTVIVICSTGLLSACIPQPAIPGPSEEQTALALVETRLAQTAAAIPPTSTRTPTPPPSPTATLTPSPTTTEIPTATPTATLVGGGGRIAYTSNRDGDFELFLIDSQGGQEAQLTANIVEDSEPAWSPDGTALAYVSYLADQRGIFTYNFQTKETTFRASLFKDRGGGPTWYEVNRILFWGDPGARTHRSVLFDLNLENNQKITLEVDTFGSPDLDPDWRFGQNRIAIAGSLTNQIHVLARNGAILTSYSPTSNPKYDISREPAWSPDMEKIAFSSDTSGEFQIYIADIHSGRVEQLTSGPGSSRHPSWSPDGQSIVYASNREGNWDIFVQDLAGNRVIRLTDDPGDDLQPVWEPIEPETILVEAPPGAGGMADYIYELFHLGFLEGLEGEYSSLEEVDKSVADYRAYEWILVPPSPKSFVIRANLAWQTDSENADWSSSGCGFVFREQDEDNHYLVFYGLDGFIHMHRVVAGEFFALMEPWFDDFLNMWMGSSIGEYVGKPGGSGQIALVVENASFSVFANGKYIDTAYDWEFQAGNLGLAVFSGSDSGYGFRCEMADVELWESR